MVHMMARTVKKQHYNHPLQGSNGVAGWRGGQRERYSTVTDLARLRGWSTSVPLSTAT